MLMENKPPVKVWNHLRNFTCKGCLQKKEIIKKKYSIYWNMQYTVLERNIWSLLLRPSVEPGVSFSVREINADDTIYLHLVQEIWNNKM